MLAHLSSGGADMAATLDAVTAGVGTINQMTAKLGEFRSAATGSYDLFTHVPLRDESGNLATVHFEGQTTLRFTSLPGGLDFNYVAFKPVSSGPPDLSPLRPKNISAPIHLEAGGKYYLESLHKEGGGGDNFAITWHKPGDPEITNGAEPIPGRFLSTLDLPVPVTITTQPTSQTVGERAGMTFSAVITGTPTYDYQWFRNNQMIIGANNPNHTIPSVQSSDNGAVFHVLTGNGISSVRSADAVLTVVSDRTPPTLVSVKSSATLDRVIVRFSEAIIPYDATNTTHFQITGGLVVNRAVLAGDGLAVTLLTSPQIPGANYSLTVTGVHDLAGSPNLIAPGSTTSFNAFIITRGFLRREVWLGIPGTTLPELTNLTRFPDAPDAVSYVTQAETPARVGDNYGVRLSGFLLPPATGDYVFYLSSDNEGALFLSTDETSTGLRLIAREPAWNPSRQWTDAPNQLSRGNPPVNVSAPIRLESGRHYYLEALMKEGDLAGDAGRWQAPDSFGITWQKPGDPVPQNSSEPIPGTYLAAPAEPLGANITIIAQPVNATVADQQTATFKIKTSDSTDERFFQWQLNGSDIPGATGRSYTTPSLTLADTGSRYRCSVSVPGGTATSSEASVTVTADKERPRLVGAKGNIGLNQVTLNFSEPLNSADTIDTSHFALDGGVKIVSSKLLPDQRSVTLITSPQSEGREYTVTVHGIRDQSTGSNAVAFNSQTRFFAWESEEFVGPFPSWADVKRDFGAKGDGVADDTDALQRALDVLGNPVQPLDPVVAGRPYVLWLPAGTYRITRGLVFKYRIAVSLFGEDPATTIIKWDGGAGGVMLHCNGVSHHVVGRLTFDGSDLALSAIDHKWDGSNQPSATTASEYSDLIIKNVQFGIRAGVASNDAEVAVQRCHFLHCSRVGISMESPQAVDWWARHSTFDHCRLGVSLGGCHVYDSVFRNSTEADFLIVCSEFVSLRDNTSIGSKAFLIAGQGGCVAQITLQGNVIIDSQDRLAIDLSVVWRVMLLDNIIRSRPDVLAGPVVHCGDNLMSIGNTFTVISPLRSDGRIPSIEDRVVELASLDLVEPALPGPLPRRNRHVVEVPAGANATTIQGAIDSVAAWTGQRPVVHLPAGTYGINKTLTLPSGLDVQLIGDGLRASTVLQWTGSGRGPVLNLQGPSKVTLRNLSILGNPKVIGVMVENCDQPGARVFMDQVTSALCRQNFIVDRLDETDVSLYSFGHGGSPEISFRVIGGPRRTSGQAVNGRVVIFGGASSGNELSYDLSNHGSFVGQDIWYEGSQPRFVRLSDSGSFSLHGGKIQRYSNSNIPAFEVANFDGDVALIATFFQESGVKVTGDGADSRVLVLGAGATPGDNVFTSDSSKAEFTLLHGVRAWFDPQVGLVTVNQPAEGYSDASFLTDLLAPTRTERPRPLTPLPASATDARFSRVLVWQCDVGILLTRSNSPPILTGTTPDQTIIEGTRLTITNRATDLDEVFNEITFSLAPGAPNGAVITTSGVFTWTPTEAQGPGKYPITVRVTDNGSPPLSAEQTFTVAVNEVNAAPVLAPVGNRSVNEGSALNFVVPASDPNDIPPNKLVLTATGLPPGATFDAATGAFAWTPGEQQEGSHKVTFTVTDDGKPPLSASETITVTVNEVNSPPILAAIPDQTVDELRELTFTVAATDSDLPAQKLTFSLVPGSAGGPPDGTIVPARSSRANEAPVSTSGIRDQKSKGEASLLTSAAEGDSGSAAVPAAPAGVASGGTSGAPDSDPARITTATHAGSEPGTPASGETRGLGSERRASLGLGNDPSTAPSDARRSRMGLLNLPSAPTIPEGANIDPVTGVFRWTPTEAHGPGKYPITVRVTDDGIPPLSAGHIFVVTVNEVNLAPKLSVVSDQAVEVGRELTFAVTATDADLPANALIFSLNPGSPEGVKITPAGAFTWTPTEAQGGVSYPIGITATDGGTPVLSDSKIFNVSVAAVQREIRVTAASVSADGKFSFTWSAQTGHSYQVQFKNNLSDADWSNIEPPVMPNGDSATFSASISEAVVRFYRVLSKP